MSKDVASLIREAREQYEREQPHPHTTFNPCWLLAKEYVPRLCDALAKKEREVERLRGVQEDAKALADRVEQLTDEMERLREQARLREIDYWILAKERERDDE